MSRYEKGVARWSIGMCIEMWTTELWHALQHSMGLLLSEAPRKLADEAVSFLAETNPDATIDLVNETIQSFILPRPMIYTHPTSVDKSRRGEYEDADAESCMVLKYRHDDGETLEAFVYFDGKFAYRIFPTKIFWEWVGQYRTPTRGMIEADPKHWGDFDIAKSEIGLRRFDIRSTPNY